MQKLFTLFAAAVMVAAGLVAGAGTTASANHGYAPRPTFTNVNTPAEVERCDSARITVKVNGNANRDPQGKVLLVVKRDKGGFKYEDVQRYSGDRIAFRTPKLCKRGGYAVRAKFAGTGDRWADSKDFGAFRVVRRG